MPELAIHATAFLRAAKPRTTLAAEQAISQKHTVA